MKAGWKTKKLEELCEVFTDGDWIESKDQSPSGIRLVQTGNVGNGIFKDRAEKARYISEDTFRRLRCTEIVEGDCLVSRLPDPVARSCIIPSLSEKCITAVDCTIIRFDRSNIIPDLFNYFSQSREYAAAVAGSVGGATRQRISRKNLGLLAIPVPPIDEQLRIVAVLDKAFASIDTATAHAQKNLTNARALFDAHVDQIFSEKGQGWLEKRLCDVCEKITDGTHQTPKYFEDGFVFLSSKNVKNRVIDWVNIKYVDAAQHAAMQKRLSPRRGDILLAKNGTTGVAAMVDRDTIFDIYVSLALLRPLQGLSPELLLHFINSPVAKRQFNKRLKGTGVPNLHLEEIREVEIAFPKSNEAQMELSQKLDSLLNHCNKLADKFSQKLAALSELRQSLLQKAFAGELT